MTESRLAPRWRPSRTGLIAGGLVVLGFALTDVSWWFIVLTGLGTFGPGILREFGWLKDKDEFQQRSAHRAGYHAFLITGLVGFGLIAWVRSGERHLQEPEELSTLFVALLWFTWFFSSLVTYLGAFKTATRILLVFGVCWLLFNVLGNLHDPIGMFMQVLVTTAPFFLLAWLAGRWPRVTGVLLVAAAIFFFIFFRQTAWRGDRISLITQAIVVVLFLGPLCGSGIALLCAQPADEPQG